MIQIELVVVIGIEFCTWSTFSQIHNIMFYVGQEQLGGKQSMNVNGARYPLKMEGSVRCFLNCFKSFASLRFV